MNCRVWLNAEELVLWRDTDKDARREGTFGSVAPRLGHGLYNVAWGTWVEIGNRDKSIYVPVGKSLSHLGSLRQFANQLMPPGAQVRPCQAQPRPIGRPTPTEPDRDDI